MKDPEEIVREIIEECGDCDVCRELMKEVCFFFPELYRLWDLEKGKGVKARSSDLKKLIESCHFCALCPCEPVRARIVEAKIAFAERDGLPWSVRLLENVELMGRVFGSIPSRFPFKGGWWIKRLLGVHVGRKIPEFGKELFDDWAKRRGLTDPSKNRINPGVAYFAGCTGRFFFTNVPKAFVRVMDKLGVPVYFFEQHCCGMPALLEGDGRFTAHLIGRQLWRWYELVKEGYKIVCSCPTCSFMMRKVLTSGAVYDERVQRLFSPEDGKILVPIGNNILSNSNRWIVLDRRFYKPVLSEGRYFSDLDPVARLVVASQTFDAGEYILEILDTGNRRFSVKGNVDRYRDYVYFPSCHQREQSGGSYYEKLFEAVGIKNITIFRDNFSCCGLGGIKGFYRDYHPKSLEIGMRLIERIERLRPRGIITECLSCRVQFEQLSDYPVIHPLEVLDFAT